ncbi:MAG: VCBS repeat-containing protein, partial [Planctomycetes bacterium]|nr:VCBS repeat-containing protein [Planctomycetota bacterium]
MLNETTGALFYAIPPAIGAATGGDVLIAVGRAFSADPQLDFAGKALTLRSRSVLRQPAGGLYTLAHDSSLEAARGRDLTLQGELIAPADASVSLSGSTFTVTAGGTLTLAAGAGVTLAAPAGSALGGTATLGAGAALRASAALTLGGAPPDFVRRVVSTTAAGAWTAGAADLDGSGGVDIFFASEGDNTIGWHQNLGGSPPEFTRWAISSTARGAHGIFPADLDADGHTDLLATYGPNQGSVVWYQNDGGMPASFSERAIAAVRGAFSVFAADVDSDGDLDVLSASNEDDTVAWYESDGGASPSFTRRVISSSADGAQSVFAADLDGDADTDVLSASYSNDTVAWHENGGEPAPVFAERVISRAADGATSVFAADLDGDGDLDVLSA